VHSKKKKKGKREKREETGREKALAKLGGVVFPSEGVMSNAGSECMKKGGCSPIEKEVQRAQKNLVQTYKKMGKKKKKKKRIGGNGSARRGTGSVCPPGRGNTRQRGVRSPRDWGGGGDKKPGV